ncbi:MAG: dihydropteroate synthase [Terrimicrobiaceae bacterium]
MIWKLKNRSIDLTHGGLIMGILNVTPDSFSDGGSFFDREAATAHGLQLAAEGADIIDVGGESTRPGAEAVDEAEELRRVIPVLRAIRERSDVLLSIDTSKASVAEEAVRAGADIINDVTALQGDPRMEEVARQSGAGVVLMHMQGRPRTMQEAPHYDDVVGEVAEFLRQRMASVLASGMAAESIALDPGIGFGKKPAHNLALLHSLGRFTALARPLLVGVSRKSFLAPLADAKILDDRFWPGVALTSFCREKGARVFRVHEPRPHREALRMTEAIIGRQPMTIDQ